MIPRVITPAIVRGSDSYFIRVSNVGKERSSDRENVEGEYT